MRGGDAAQGGHAGDEVEHGFGGGAAGVGGAQQAARHHVHRDAVLAQVVGRCAGEREQRGLGGGVVVVGHHGVLEQVGAHVHDAAKALFAHGGQGGLGGVECAFDGAFELLGKALPGDVANLRAGVAIKAELGQGVVDHGADGLTGAFAHLGKQALHGGGIGHVGLQGQGAGAQFFGQGLGSSVAVQVVDDDPSAFARQRAGDGLAQPPGAAGDQNPLFRQLHDVPWGR